MLQVLPKANSGFRVIVAVCCCLLQPHAPGIAGPCSSKEAAETTWDIIVAPSGWLQAPGTLDMPTTLEGARALIQSNQGKRAIRVLVRAGIYPRLDPLTLRALDSGRAGQEVLIVGAHMRIMPHGDQGRHAIGGRRGVAQIAGHGRAALDLG